MREISAGEVKKEVARLFFEASFYLPDDVIKAIQRAKEAEESPAGKEVLDTILKNTEIAAREQVPLCQDCGTAVVFIEIGQDVHITGGNLNEAVNEGVREAYDKGYKYEQEYHG